MLYKPVSIERFGRCALLAWRHAVEARTEPPVERRRPSLMTGHMLLGIMQEPTCAGGLILRKLGLDLHLAIDTTRFVLFYGRRKDGLDERPIGWQDVPHTPSTMRAIEHSLNEANLFHADYPIGTEHLLLGMLQVTDSLGFSILEHFGITQSGVRQARDLFWERLNLSEG